MIGITESSLWPVYVKVVNEAIKLQFFIVEKQVIEWTQCKFGSLYIANVFETHCNEFINYQNYSEWSWPHDPEAEIFRFLQIKPLNDNFDNFCSLLSLFSFFVVGTVDLPWAYIAMNEWTCNSFRLWTSIDHLTTSIMGRNWQPRLNRWSHGISCGTWKIANCELFPMSAVSTS